MRSVPPVSLNNHNAVDTDSVNLTVTGIDLCKSFLSLCGSESRVQLRISRLTLDNNSNGRSRCSSLPSVDLPPSSAPGLVSRGDSWAKAVRQLPATKHGRNPAHWVLQLVGIQLIIMDHVLFNTRILVSLGCRPSLARNRPADDASGLLEWCIHMLLLCEEMPSHESSSSVLSIDQLLMCVAAFGSLNDSVQQTIVKVWKPREIERRSSGTVSEINYGIPHNFCFIHLVKKIDFHLFQPVWSGIEDLSSNFFCSRCLFFFPFSFDLVWSCTTKLLQNTTKIDEDSDCELIKQCPLISFRTRRTKRYNDWVFFSFTFIHTFVFLPQCNSLRSLLTTTEWKDSQLRNSIQNVSRPPTSCVPQMDSGCFSSVRVVDQSPTPSTLSRSLVHAGSVRSASSTSFCLVPPVHKTGQMRIFASPQSIVTTTCTPISLSIHCHVPTAVGRLAMGPEGGNLFGWCLRDITFMIDVRPAHIKCDLAVGTVRSEIQLSER